VWPESVVFHAPSFVDAQIIKWERYMGPIHLSGLNRYALKDRKIAKSQAEENIRIPSVVNITTASGKLEHGKV
jgi:hypothetical protein